MITRISRLSVLAISCLFAAACANPVSAVRVDPKTVYGELGQSVVATGTYSNAHIEPVESELVVKSSHSTQGNPHTIEEVRRILRLHAGLP